ncbi:MAG: pantetheine-phosphate adenylyltransferase [Galactobacter sp.]|uniref:pantetheine-phosphate adenylyltransferase n=1 Tax=Galactobacter sp. TaxID=2676125 RepID=UPI0025C4670C|nr:pantetheine-phosphate adenylyltransferase [Galactobacter sp.]
MRRVVCPGSFDPVHKGHLEIIMRAAVLFDEVVVAVSTNPDKSYRFSEDERVEMVRESVAGFSGITVAPMGNGLLATYVKSLNADAILKGLRSSADFEFESPMAAMNRHLTGVETIYLQGDGAYAQVSSSLIKQVAGLGGDISAFVPKAVISRLS